MKKIKVLCFVMLLYSAIYAEFERPVIHSTIMLDAHFYGNENDNNGNYNNANRFQIRKTSIALEGIVNKNIDYMAEFALSTCSGTGTQVQLSEAKLLYLFNQNLKFGFQQGHILNGFVNATECPSRLTMEKPFFVTSFNTCHPLGAVLNYYHDFSSCNIETELAIVNGDNSTLSKENQSNFGTIIQTPITGLALAGSYTRLTKEYMDNDYNSYSENGYRSTCGLDYHNNNIAFTTEYYTGEGFTLDNQKMEAWYIQLGYDYKLNYDKLNAIQMYAMYEFWDQNIKLDKEYSNYEIGLNFKLSSLTMLRFAYNNNIDSPELSIKDPSEFTVRLQTSF